MRHSIFLSALCAGLLLAAACGGDNPGNPSANGNNGGNNAANNNANSDSNNANSDSNSANNATNNPNSDTNNPNNTNNSNNTNNANNNTPEDDPFSECEADSDCNGEQACSSGVCLERPTGMVEAQAVFERDTLYPLGAPNVACFQDPQVNPFPVEYVTVEGSIAKFGTGGKTVDLCVTVYNQARLLEDFLAKCQGIDDADERYQCFRTDPCRCEEENEGDQGAIDECFAGIGYCNGIQDAGLKAECQQTYAYDGDNPDRDPSIESTLIYGHTVSFEVPEDSEEGHFAVSGVPISTELVVKVSGREQRWIDTYEFGAIIREARDGDGGRVARSDGNVISLGAWRTIPGTALVPGGIQDGNGAVAGRLYDCGMEGRSVEADGQTRDASGYLGIENGTVGLLNDATRITYFNGNPNDTLPQPNRVTTDGLGLYAAIDVPGGPNRVSTAIYYDGELINVGARDLFLPPMSVGIVTFEGNILPAAW